MTEQERRQRFYDLQEMVLTKGYKWLLRMFDEQIKEEQDSFLRIENDEGRLKKQMRLQILHELRGWADEEIMRCKSLDSLRNLG